MVGYGHESSTFVLELTYNYGIKEYELGNEFGGVVIKSPDIIENVKSKSYPFEDIPNSNGDILIKAPGGFKFFIFNQKVADGEDPMCYIIYNVSNLENSVKYWNGLLNMSILRQDSKKALLSYNGGKFGIEFSQIDEAINRAKAYGRIAFAVPYDLQPSIDEMIQNNKKTILTPLVVLDTPGKASVRVIILADDDGHEICFVDDEGFSQLSEYDPKSEADLDKYIKKDPFQE